MKQHLSAILFSDLAGFSTLMSEDKNHALEILEVFKSIHLRHIENHNGTMLKELGDGFLISFDSAIDACECAIDIKASSLKIEGIHLHIGVDLGEIVYEKGDAFGDGVNIASRIEHLALKDQILISDNVYRAIRNEKNFEIKFQGKQHLKNIPGQIRVYELIKPGDEFHKGFDTIKHPYIVFFGIIFMILLMGAYLYDKLNRTLSKQDTIDLVVLSLNTLGNDELEYLGTGLTYEIRNRLAGVNLINVRSVNSGETFTSNRASLINFGKKLSVEYVLDGTVQQFGDKIRFNFFLKDLLNDKVIPILAEDHSTNDLYSLQVDIAQAILEQLSKSLSINGKSNPNRIDRIPTNKPEAHRYYLQGLHSLKKGTHSSDLDRAKAYFLNALKIDQNYAEAHIAMGQLYLERGYFGYEDKRTSLESAKNQIMKGLSLYPESSVGHNALGMIHMEMLDPLEAKKELEMAADLDPGNDEIYYNLFRLYIYWNDPEKAFNMLSKAFSLNPIASNYAAELAGMYNFIGETDSALLKLRHEIVANPNNYYALWILGTVYIELDSLDQAIDVFTSRDIDANNTNWALAVAYARKGHKKLAREIALRLESKYDTLYVPPSIIGIIYYELDEMDTARTWMRLAYKRRDHFPRIAKLFEVMDEEKWFQDWFYLGTIDKPRNPYQEL